LKYTMHGESTDVRKN